MTEYVYAIGCPAVNGLVKIGRSVSLGRRLAEIQRYSPVPLAVLWKHEGGGRLEVALHGRFYQRRRHGEWFDFGHEDAAAIINANARSLLARYPVLAEADAPRSRVQRQRAEGGGTLRLLILSYIVGHGGAVRTTEIASALDIRVATVSQTCARLVDEHLIRKPTRGLYVGPEVSGGEEHAA